MVAFHISDVPHNSQTQFHTISSAGGIFSASENCFLVKTRINYGLGVELKSCLGEEEKTDEILNSEKSESFHQRYHVFKELL